VGLPICGQGRDELIFIFQFSHYIDQHKVAIVCSARSGSTKALGTTNLLLRSASQALKRRGTPGTTTPVTTCMTGQISDASARLQDSPASPRRRSSSSPRSCSPAPFVPLTPISPPPIDETLPEFHATVELIRQEHLTAAKASVHDLEILQDLEAEIERDCDWLKGFLSAAQVCILP
jgi:aspartate kinase